MMSIERRIIGMSSIVVAYLAIPLVYLSLVTENQRLWFANIFFDKLYIYQLVPMFIIGLAKIDEKSNIFSVVRYKNRITALKMQLFEKYIYSFIYLTIWFVLLTTFSIIRFKYIYEIDISQIINWYIRYLLGLLIIVNIGDIFKKSNIKIFSSSAYIGVYILIVLEVIAIIPEINNILPCNICVVFSWIFCKSSISYGVLILIWGISTYYLFRVSARKDIF